MHAGRVRTCGRVRTYLKYLLKNSRVRDHASFGPRQNARIKGIVGAILLALDQRTRIDELVGHDLRRRCTPGLWYSGPWI